MCDSTLSENVRECSRIFAYSQRMHVYAVPALEKKWKHFVEIFEIFCWELPENFQETFASACKLKKKKFKNRENFEKI